MLTKHLKERKPAAENSKFVGTDCMASFLKYDQPLYRNESYSMIDARAKYKKQLFT